ncbi:hypothetical protein [Legionella bononiensis]|uniref:Tfp type 4 fimbrial pilin related signal peptide protein domain protein n=1 Tax=Legionella bononiensis TaxID=2793102 RepID=A0ABS1WBG0_9GAMM|nr:hypothetical protein [Legionella bononiensis]MBL7480975.1 hypothetical protein [Legionella bononiensis]MBL7526682.1 hypothetical protein [Legionella bononiensis]MBL7564089.1 hypothetical protein [Legionella bononiensis]
MINLGRSYQLSRVHLAIVLCLIAILAGTLLSYFELLEATVEKTTVSMNLNMITNLVHSKSILLKQTNPDCSYLNEPDFILQASGFASPELQESGYWQYNPVLHQLTYKVRGKRYFWSKNDHQIVVDLYCNKGIVEFTVSSYRWCQDMRLWGCHEW